jgi:hypothetical protein
MPVETKRRQMQSMDLEKRVAQHFNHSIATKQGAAAALVPVIASASGMITEALLAGGRSSVAVQPAQVGLHSTLHPHCSIALNVSVPGCQQSL